MKIPLLLVWPTEEQVWSRMMREACSRESAAEWALQENIKAYMKKFSKIS